MSFRNRMWGAAAIGAALLSGAGLGAPARAAYVVTLTQVGANVIAAGSGTIDLSGLTFLSVAAPSPPELSPNGGLIATGPLGATPDVYRGFTGPASFGPGLYIQASSGSGDYVGIDGSDNILAVPDGYVSGGALSDAATFDGATLASLGVTPGTYVWTWGISALADDSFTLKVASVPEPTSLGLLVLPLGLVMLRATRRNSAA